MRNMIIGLAALASTVAISDDGTHHGPYLCLVPRPCPQYGMCQTFEPCDHPKEQPATEAPKRR